MCWSSVFPRCEWRSNGGEATALAANAAVNSQWRRSLKASSEAGHGRIKAIRVLSVEKPSDPGYACRFGGDGALYFAAVLPAVGWHPHHQCSTVLKLHEATRKLPSWFKFSNSSFARSARSGQSNSAKLSRIAMPPKKKEEVKEKPLLGRFVLLHATHMALARRCHSLVSTRACALFAGSSQISR